MSEDVTLKELVNKLAEERGLDLRVYKPTTLERRVQKRMQQVGIGTYPEYLEKIRSEPREINELLNVVLINVTEFFRDPQAWEIIQTAAIPKLFARLKPGDTFRAWSAGCASGEEAYSLALVIADHLGPRLTDYDIKIYATDIDEEALQIARHGEYPADRLRLIRPEWRERYFQGTSKLRIIREVRRMVIFGRSNLVSDAPISHCNLIVCRNVLIYMGTAAQKQVFTRLHYVLEPDGVLFLGKAESRLSESELFRPLNSRWRIFQRIDRESREPRLDELFSPAANSEYERRLRDDVGRLQVQHQLLMHTVRSGVITLDPNDIITACNEAAQTIWRLPGPGLVGRRLQNTDLLYRCPELGGRLETARNSKEPVHFQAILRSEDGDRTIAIVLRSIFADKDERIGTLMNCEDVTSNERLQSTIEQLEATGEELQSANEELETTNEELQSTNEELETTNEELQSTNEELETTNEELQSLNEELENMNQELETRSRELNALSGRYEETLRRMPWPVILVNRDLRIQLWNNAAQKLFGVSETSVVSVELSKLPTDSALMKNLLRRCRAVLEGNKTLTIRDQKLRTAGGSTSFDVQFTPASRNENEVDGVLMMFGPFRGGTQERGTEPVRVSRGNSGRSGGDRKNNKSRGKR